MIMPANGEGALSLLSPLAVDMAISHASVAALKALTNLPFSPEDTAAASSLRGYFSTRLQFVGAPRNVSESLVIQTDKRALLDEALATIYGSSEIRLGDDEEALYKQIIECLDRSILSEKPEPETARRLLEALKQWAASVGDSPTSNPG